MVPHAMILKIIFAALVQAVGLVIDVNKTLMNAQLWSHLALKLALALISTGATFVSVKKVSCSLFCISLIKEMKIIELTNHFGFISTFYLILSNRI